MVNYEDIEPSEQICLETGQAGTQPMARETFADGGYQLELSDDEPWCSSVTTDLSSWPTALLGWMYKIPGLVSEQGETTVAITHSGPVTNLQKKDRQE